MISAQTARRAAWTAWGVTAGLLVLWLPLVRLAKTQEGDLFPMILLPTFVLGFATVGTLITSRQPTNRIGLAYIVLALGGAVAMAAGSYAQLPFSQGWHVLGFRVAAWLGRFGFGTMALPLAFVYLLFPNGRVPTSRWRPVLWVMLVAAGVNIVGYALTPGPVASGFTYTPPKVTNPVGLPMAWKGVVEAITGWAGMVVVLGGFLGVLALALRYRRSVGEERQQIRWLAYAGMAAVGLLLVGLLVLLVLSLFGVRLSGDATWELTIFPSLLIVMIGTPVASLVAAFRYHLWDLDLVVKKALIAGVLVVTLGAIGGAIIATLGQFAFWDNTARGVSVAVGVVVGLLFVPVLRVSRRIADRIVYGGRATPYEVLTDFSHRMAETYATEDVLPRMAAILAAGTRAERATIWLVLGGELRPAAAWPAGSAASTSIALNDLAERDGFEVRHLGELLGAITVEMPANDPMTPGKERLVRDLAAQAGPVLRNVRLIEDLRASRQRLVAAQDEERRKIERNLHDGAQQQLVALAVKLRLAQGIALQEAAARTETLLGQAQSDTTEALENLRDLARGIYPPLLADQGLAAALEAQARKSAVPVRVEPDGVGRYAPEIEATVYFCTLEALQNVAKYAQASTATVRLRAEDGTLRFEITDDGRGFDPASTGYGTGLQGMADRLDAIGGQLEVRSSVGAGTTVSGSLPIRGNAP
jgi:signal transduction histidine kinase